MHAVQKESAKHFERMAMQEGSDLDCAVTRSAAEKAPTFLPSSPSPRHDRQDARKWPHLLLPDLREVSPSLLGSIAGGDRIYQHSMARVKSFPLDGLSSGKLPVYVWL